MIDTLAIAHQLVDAGLEQRPAEAIARAIRNGQGDSATQDFVRAEIGVVRGEMGELRGEIGELRGEIGELRGEIGELRGEIGTVRADMTKQFNSLLRWIMGLGFGAIAGVLAQLVFQILQQ